MRLIDAERLKASLRANVPPFAQELVSGMHMIIDFQPTIEAEPVIHCKDCKYYEAKQKGKPWKVSREYCGRTITLNMNPNDFCSRGERMDENSPCSKSVRGSTDSRMAVQGDTTVGAKMDEVEKWT